MMLAALLLTAAQEPLARWTLTPDEVVIGQPIACVLEVAHAPGNGPAAPDLATDYAWEVIDGPLHELTAAGSRVTWTVLALEPGEHAWPDVEVVLADGSHLVPARGALSVAGELGEGEDVPPAMPGFRTVDERTSPVRPRHLILALLLTAVGAASFLVWRRNHKPRGEDEPTELERFNGLGRDDPHAIAFELSALVRRATEKHLGLAAPRHALTDDEWLEALQDEARCEPSDREELRAVLALCGDIKFAGSRPTRFAVDELLTRTGGLLQRLAAPLPDSEDGTGAADERAGRDDA